MVCGWLCGDVVVVFVMGEVFVFWCIVLCVLDVGLCLFVWEIDVLWVIFCGVSNK